MGKFESFAPLVGRILLAQIFIASGLNGAGSYTIDSQTSLSSKTK